MATKIKLTRIGKMREPHYRIVVADSRNKRDGRSIETIGEYHPKNDPSVMKVDGDRAAYWLGVGAQPTEAVTAILKVTGDWQKFKGEPDPPPMKLAAEKQDKQALFNSALAEAGGDTTDTSGAATTPKKKAVKATAKTAPEAKSAPTAKTDTASDAAKTDAAKTDAAKTDAAKTDAAKTDAAKTDAAKTDAAETDAA
ncbi:MAG: 30S ribosomal protein S16, partial [Jatrophihabitans sp.]